MDVNISLNRSIRVQRRLYSSLMTTTKNHKQNKLISQNQYKQYMKNNGNTTRLNRTQTITTNTHAALRYSLVTHQKKSPLHNITNNHTTYSLNSHAKHHITHHVELHTIIQSRITRNILPYTQSKQQTTNI